MLKDGWLAGDLGQVDAVEWVNPMLKVMSEIVQVKERKANEQMKKGYMISMQLRVFSVGSMVLVRTLDMEENLSGDGPYSMSSYGRFPL